MMQLDHIMYAVPNLDEGVADIAARTGVQPAYGGPHPGRGTHNALLSLGDSRYLEIIAADPAQADVVSDLDGLDAPRIKTWAVATDAFGQVQRVCDARGLTCSRVAMSRNTPAGPTLNWELLFVSGHQFGELFPFFIDWLESPHPAATTLRGGSLQSFCVEVPDPAAFEALLAAFHIDGVQVVSGHGRLHAEIACANGNTLRL